MFRILFVLAAGVSLVVADKLPPEALVKLARERSPQLESALRETLGAESIQKGTGFAADHGSFVAVVASEKEPALQVDVSDLRKASKAGSLWYYSGELKTGTSHRLTWLVDGKVIGVANNVPAFTDDSYPKPGVPQGKLTGPLVLESKIYPGMKANVWFYVPAQHDGSTPLPVQIWGDGQMYVTRPSPYRVLDALDNLTQQKRIPLMVNVFIQPGTAGEQRLRSIQYDTVDDTYARYLLEEILPEIGKQVKLRSDGYSRSMVGESSGGICAFNAAFLKPDQFSRVLSWIGSFTKLQKVPGERDGGYVYPLRARIEPKRNIRVWLQDGAEDQEIRPGSWPLQNIQLANSLKMAGYDYRFSFGLGTHNQMQGASELPESLIWLWRGYDPAKQSEEFVQDPEEKNRPMWRVVTLNRDR